jgi:hypothetical protein
MKNNIIWIGFAVVTVLLIVGAWWQKQKRKREVEDLKRQSGQAIETLIGNKDAVIEALQEELKAQQQVPVSQNAADLRISYPVPKVVGKETTLKPEIDKVEYKKPAQQPSQKKEKINKTPSKASPEEVALHGHLTHELESTDLPGQIKLIEAFLANPIAKQYKGLMTKKLNELRKNVELAAIE